MDASTRKTVALILGVFALVFGAVAMYVSRREPGPHPLGVLLAGAAGVCAGLAIIVQEA
jgi:NhaP-type Na+/H+ or K+/H+ antiporter